MGLNYQPLCSWFFEVLKFNEWPIFSFFMILFSQMGLSKWAIIGAIIFSRGYISQMINFSVICRIYVPKKPTIQYSVSSHTLTHCTWSANWHNKIIIIIIIVWVLSRTHNIRSCTLNVIDTIPIKIMYIKLHNSAYSSHTALKYYNKTFPISLLLHKRSNKLLTNKTT